LSLPDFGINNNRPRILISGGGDGALQDFLRVVVSPRFQSPKDVLRRLAIQLDWLKRIQDVHDCSERKVQWDVNTRFNHAVLEFLQRRFDEAVDDFLLHHHDNPAFDATMSEIVRDPLPEVYFVMTCNHFGRCYPLNRFLGTLLMAYLGKRRNRQSLPLFNRRRRVIDIQGRARQSPPYRFAIDSCTGCYDDRPLGSVQTGEADIVILRHGFRWDNAPEGLKPLISPPRTQQLLPYGFVSW
jgi:hypothetical protein